MKTVTRVALLALAGLFLAAVIWALLSRPPAAPTGAAAPPTAGSDADGVAFQLSDYRGRVVLLDFWGNW